MKQEANVSCGELSARHLGPGLYLSRSEHRICGTVFRIMLGHLKPRHPLSRVSLPAYLRFHHIHIAQKLWHWPSAILCAR